MTHYDIMVVVNSAVCGMNLHPSSVCDNLIHVSRTRHCAIAPCLRHAPNHCLPMHPFCDVIKFARISIVRLALSAHASPHRRSVFSILSLFLNHFIIQYREFPRVEHAACRHALIYMASIRNYFTFSACVRRSAVFVTFFVLFITLPKLLVFERKVGQLRAAILNLFARWFAAHFTVAIALTFIISTFSAVAISERGRDDGNGVKLLNYGSSKQLNFYVIRKFSYACERDTGAVTSALGTRILQAITLRLTFSKGTEYSQQTSMNVFDYSIFNDQSSLIDFCRSS